MQAASLDAHNHQLMSEDYRRRLSLVASDMYLFAFLDFCHFSFSQSDVFTALNFTVNAKTYSFALPDDVVDLSNSLFPLLLNTVTGIPLSLGPSIDDDKTRL